MSSRAARSSSTLQAARSAVAERARRYAAPAPKGPAAKAGGSKGGKGGSGRGKPGAGSQRRAKEASAAASGGKSARSTAVVLRRVQPASVLRLSVLFYLSLSLALFTAGVLLWIGANAVGLVANVESFMDEVGFTDFRLRSGQLLMASALATVVLVIAGSLANYLMAVLYNLIGDLVGGIKVVLTEDQEISKK